MACHLPRSNCATTTCHCNHRCCNQSHHLPPPSLHQAPIDPLVQALTSLLQQHQPSPHYAHINYQEPNFTRHSPQFLRYDHNPRFESLISSLLQRITNLESSLYHFSTASSSRAYSNVRDVAARVIQTHFRAFLVRRSRTLRQLKELAFIKSSFSSLISSVSTNTHFDSHLVSRKVADLLLKLNSIESGDPMISDGKRSISKEMVSFLESIDGFVVKKKVILSKSVKNSGAKFVKSANKGRNLKSKDDEDARDILDKLRVRLEKIEGFSRVCENDQKDVELEGFHQFVDHDDNEDGDDNNNSEHDVLKISNGFCGRGHGVGPKVKKTVRFNDNGNVYIVSGE